ncbi:hypothetical protein V490_03720, partial [Pseudogymnoascus sp. VKM F-3557]
MVLPQSPSNRPITAHPQKRRISSLLIQTAEDDLHHPSKKQKLNYPAFPPAGFWDSLWRIPLTRNALRELNERNGKGNGRAVLMDTFAHFAHHRGLFCYLPDVRSKNLLFSKVSDLPLADATANTIKTDMSSTFSAGTGTPLYFSKWMPISITAYTGTCVFLIVLAISFRVLIAFRKSNTKERNSSDSNSKIALLTENGVEEDVMVVRKQMKGPMPWSIAVDG